MNRDRHHEKLVQAFDRAMDRLTGTSPDDPKEQREKALQDWWFQLDQDEDWIESNE